jgi:hypothetical protein
MNYSVNAYGGNIERKGSKSDMERQTQRKTEMAIVRGQKHMDGENERAF